MAKYEDFHEHRIKHLDMIQAVIARLGTDSFLMKGWAVTVAGAFFGFAVNSDDWKLSLVSVAPILTFWGLDTYFLRSERLFRDLFERVRSGDEMVGPFFMGATSPDYLKLVSQDTKSWWKTFRRPTLSIFYGVLAVAAGLITLVVAVGGDPAGATP